MRFFRNRKNLEIALESYREEERTSRSISSILDKCLGSSAFIHILEALFYWIPYATFALILLALIIPVLSKYRNMARCNTLSDRRAIFFTLFEDRIRREFRSQSAETMSTIVTAVSHILRPSPERPSILLCLAPPAAKDTCGRISRATASAVMASFQKPSHDVDKSTLNCSNYASSDQFWRFYEDMTERMSSHKVVVLSEFEKINATVATALCHLADDTYAPFPQSIVIACLDIGNRFESTDLRRQAAVTLAETYLEEKWDSSLDPVSLTEILGRLTGRAVLIERELPCRRLTGSLSSIKGYSGPSPKLRRRRRTAVSEMRI